MTIRIATDERDFPEIAALMRAYLAELNVDLCFQDFEGELSNLSRAYAAPDGALLIARSIDSNEQAAGCVALRRVNDTTCEMKRLYVRPDHRRAGQGRRLVEAAVAEARRMGFSRMCLNTVPPKMPTAVAMYRAMGFTEIEKFDCHPVDGTLAMGIVL